MKTNKVRYKYKNVRDINIFYRKAGDPDNDTIILLYGLPTLSLTCREVLADLSVDYQMLILIIRGLGSVISHCRTHLNTVLML